VSYGEHHDGGHSPGWCGQSGHMVAGQCIRFLCLVTVDVPGVDWGWSRGVWPYRGIHGCWGRGQQGGWAGERERSTRRHRVGVSGRHCLRCRTSGGIMECLVGQPIEVKLTSGHIPAMVAVVSWSVCPRLCNFVLHCCIQAWGNFKTMVMGSV
jgi:hypothetical protein